MYQTAPLKTLQSFGDKHLWFDEPILFVRHLPGGGSVVVGQRASLYFISLEISAIEGELKLSGNLSVDHALSPDGRLLAFALWGIGESQRFVLIDLLNRFELGGFTLSSEAWVT
jgi:hypothetical protein